MPVLSTHQLSFQLDTGEWLFQNLNFSLTSRLTGLVGRNGVGKSVFLSLLLRKLTPVNGYVTSQGKVAYYSQISSHLLDGDLRIADFLGISNKLLALKAIEQGYCLQEYFDLIGDDWDIKNKTKHTLKTLKIDPNLNAYCHTLSGGQLARLQLYQLFNSDAEILLLDEPSNHLDYEGKQWLINQLKQFAGQILLVSHDRSLLSHVDGIYQLTSLGLGFFKGNYEAYSAQSSTQAEALERQITHVKAEQRRVERQAQTNKEKALQRERHGNRIRKSGSQPKVLMDAKKDKAAQSRSATVINQQNHLQRNQEKLRVMEQQKEVLKPQVLYLQQASQIKKRRLLNIENCQLYYGSGKPVSLILFHADRCYLNGANGCGKSTLLKAIQNNDLSYSGVIELNVKTVYLDQHFGLLKLEESMLENLIKSSKELTENTARILLAGIGFRRDSVYRKVANLSGGEKMKLSMLVVSHLANSPLLLLDEPDNHLDIESKQTLAAALNAYKGAFILVSHDEDFVSEIRTNKHIVM
ncbi:ABC-F family ATP-binding cassette domain-containing protein [Moritella sp. 5]|uniref:ATP-binding cassette domain-containing protein n=1 Tax=Moritella sp. 5 TaxID=2746231 RepID=UPI001BA63EEB|nr:ATP-binding cassette domain-containing protein [Moritella sp. 5]QUM80818.1 ABC-F family ATP-binding cassette domain-containing protein [Moritella sp. 5]